MTTPHTEDQKPAAPQVPIDPNKLLLPGAILIAGLMISGTIFYTNSTASIGNAGAQQNAPEASSKKITVPNLKKWAKEIKLDSKSFDACLDAAKYKDEIKKDIADGSAAGVSGTPSFLVNGWMFPGAQPLAVFKDVIDQVTNGSKNVTADLGRGRESLKQYQVSMDDDPVLGNANAPITIIEFSDYECPFCKRFYDQTFGQIKKDYIDTGKVKFIYRDYPLSFHPGAEPAAQAANCAGEQGKYWEMHDKIFQAQG